MKKLILSLLWLCFICFEARPQSTIRITAEKDYIKLDNSLQVLVDSTKSWTISQITSEEFSKKFETSARKAINFGLNTSLDAWARVTLSSDAAQTYWLEMANILPSARIFYFDSLQNRLVELKKEYGTPNKDVLRLPTSVFPIPLSPSPTTFYFKLQYTIPFNVPIILWQPTKFVVIQSNLYLFFGIFLGVVTMMFLYNLLSYLLIRDVAFLLYALLILIEGIINLVINGYAYLLTNLYWDYETSTIIQTALFPLGGIVKTFFCLYFLKVRKHSKLFFRILLAKFSLPILILYFALSSQVILFSMAVFISNVIAHLILFALGLSFIKYLKSSAVFFTIATATHLLGIVIVLLEGLNIWELDYIDYKYSISILNAVTYGFEIIFVSLAISNQVNLMKAELIQKEYEKKMITQEQALKLKYEKERISKDLHDNIGSQLTYLAKNLEQLKQQPENEKIDNLTEMTTNIVQDLRNMIWVINKEEISVRELEDKIANLLWKTLGQMDNMKYEISTDFQKEMKLTASQALNLFRICQEALQNAIKYSQAQNFDIQLSTNENGQLCLQIRDDGVGFDLDQAKNKKGHYGLQNMESRAEEIGGIFKIETATGKGTKIEVKI